MIGRGRERAGRATLLAALVTLAGCAGSAGAGSTGDDGEPVHVRVAAAADLKFALDEIVDAFQEASSGVEVTVSYGSSGTFVQQISNGAPFDVYLSADVGYVEDLVDAGLADGDAVFHYAAGRLVVWAPEGSAAEPARGLEGLADESVRTVAVANPEHAPYGRAAVAALRSAGVYEQVRGKLVLGENVSQAAEFARSGNADAGVLALSLAMSPTMSDGGRYAEVPPGTFPRLEQAGTVLPGAPDAAHDLAGFLTSPEGQAVLARYGFGPPEGQD